jgi:hypothetical protein
MWIRDSNLPQDLDKVVRYEAVSTELREESEGGADERTMSHSFCLCQLRPSARSTRVFKFERFADFGDFDMGKFLRCIALCMVFDQDLKRFFAPIFADQPSRALGDGEGEDDLDDGGPGLQDGREAPAPVALDQECADDDAGA